MIRRYVHNVSDQIISSQRLDGGVQLITIDRPPVNALASDDWHLLQEHVLSAGVDTDVRCVVLTGTNRSFCAGADIRQLTEDAVANDGTTALRVVAQTADAIGTLRIPVIAAIDGAAHGGGLELALSCDIRLAGPTATFAAAGVNMGLIASVGSLIESIGDARARSMLLTGTRVDIDTALDWGLVTERPYGDVTTAAIAIAHHIAQKPPLAVEATKRAATEFHHLRRTEHGHLMDLLFTELAGSDDHVEALAAFLEKRPGDYKRT